MSLFTVLLGAFPLYILLQGRGGEYLKLAKAVK